MTGPKRPAGSLADVPYSELLDALRTQTNSALARHYGVDRTTVRYWRRKLLGMPGESLPCPPPAWCPQTCALFTSQAPSPPGESQVAEAAAG